nr:MAG TPA: baseplate protein [Caudoviricetes sp.]
MKLDDIGLKKVFELIKGRIWKECYPVGSIYMSVNSTDPSTLFGGSWERIQDKFLLASGSEYDAGSTGGSADAVVVKHLHQPSTGDGFNAYMSGTVERARVGMSTASGARYTIVGKKNASSVDASGLRFAGSTDWTGSDGTGKNMPPYLAVYVWKRTA